MKQHPLRKIRIINKAIDKYTNRVTPVGTFFIIVFFVSTIFGLDPAKSMLFQISTFSFSLLLVSFLFTMRFKTDIKVERNIPDLCTINKKTTYSLFLKNQNKSKISGLFFKDVVKPFLITSMIQKIPDINSNDSATIDVLFTPEKRGYIHIEGINIYKEDPLGLFRKQFFIKTSANLLVLPKMYNVPYYKFTGKRKHNRGGIPFAEKKGESEEFISLKKYTPGDPTKKINWKATAKTGEIIVNEFQDEYFSRYGLALDTFTDKNNIIFEEAISIAASILTSNNSGGSILDLMFLGIKYYNITVGRGINSQKSALEILASILPCKDRQFTNLTLLIKKQIPLLNSIVLILIDIDDDRTELINLLSKYDIEIKIILISEDPDKSLRKIEELNTKVPIKILKTGEIEESLSGVIQ